LRPCLAALLFGTLSLFGGPPCGGITGWTGLGSAQVQRSTPDDDARLLHADLLLLDAAAPGAPAMHKPERSSGGMGHSHAPQFHAGLGAVAQQLSIAKVTSVKLRERARPGGFTPVQRLVIYPHHGFW
jgi:hypothetical protein